MTISQFDNYRYNFTIFAITASMSEQELKDRFKQFSIRIINMVNCMPNTISGKAIACQVVRSGTSPAANYRAACIAKSNKDFLNKLKMVEEELDETSHWLEIITDTGMLAEDRIKPLHDECIALLKIIVSSIVTTRKYLNSNSDKDNSQIVSNSNSKIVK